jgi:hypothetical protein
MITEPNPLDAPENDLPSRLWWKILPFSVMLCASLIGALVEFPDAMIRPFAMTLGQETTALVSSKRTYRGRRVSGNYVELNYRYSDDYAPRSEVRVNDAAYAAISSNTRVAIHFIPGCASCVALDDDKGSARWQLSLYFLVMGALTASAVWSKSAP